MVCITSKHVYKTKMHRYIVLKQIVTAVEDVFFLNEHDARSSAMEVKSK